MTKQCNKCTQYKEFSRFDLKNGKPCRNTCKDCRNHNMKSRPYRKGLPLKDYRLQMQYGITLKQYDEMAADQNGLCKLCNRVSLNHWGTELCVDHCHKTGKVRGLLCDKCNKGLGQFEDNIETLQKAIEYLKT